jgi:class 3 adenylate cyclase/tetratricopeptide (TPR) repeat protein
MKCSRCESSNPNGAKFCIECGNALEYRCPKCGAITPGKGKFCMECGHSLGAPETPKPQELVTTSDVESERKHVTVLFSDLSGYTSMTERLDPEEVKEIMSRIFGEIAQVITRYEGFIERFVGDAVMAIFGVPKAHEDDPVRAVKAAIEIHKLVEQISPKLEEKTGVSLSMHSGINTGLVVTGEVKLDQGTHGLTGDVINTAARLQGLAKTGEILVGYETHRQTEGFFDYDELEATKLKGKEKPVPVYRMVSPKDKPFTIHRLSGVRANLIGRKSEIALLREALQNLRGGKGSIFSICGDAGTGKSRLVEDFKADLAPGEIQVLEGHAYAHTQNIPYYPLIGFFNGVFGIEEADPPEKIREKVLSGVEGLLGRTEHIVPFIGNLYSLDHPELSDVSPDLWKHRIQEGVKAILSALCRRMPTVFFLEDLHWADSSFLELLRKTLFEIRDPALVLCAYRPPFSLFTSHQLGSFSGRYHEIRLQDLSPSEAQDMVCSLLKTDSLPPDLRRFVQGKAEGNPFYLEEVINSLIESKALVRDDGNWRLTKQICDLEISSSIHGVILARLDRLEKESKRILQEASVIGRAFLYEILKMITDNKEQIDRCLNGLERLDLIRTRSLQPDLEYVFKHVLTQEAVYNGLLKKERQEIHERIGLVMEQLFRDRLAEFYETLAFHFKQGLSIRKAVAYLMKAGSKSYSRYALEESHQYFKEAFDLLSGKTQGTEEDEKLMIELIVSWGFTLHLRADFAALSNLFKAHESLVETHAGKEHRMMFYGWLGFALGRRMFLQDGYQYLHKALQLAEETGNLKAIGYNCAWLAHACADIGLLEEAVVFGKKARDIAIRFESDPYLFEMAYAFSAYAHSYKGDLRKVADFGQALLNYGTKCSDLRAIAWHHTTMGLSRLSAGDVRSTIDHLKAGIQVSPDPMTAIVAKVLLGACYLATDQLEDAQSTIEEVIAYSEKYGYDIAGTPAQAFKGMILMAKGDLKQGLNICENAMRITLEQENLVQYASLNCLMGKIYSRIAKGGGEKKSLSLLLKNAGFLVKTLPHAHKIAEKHFNLAINTALDIGAKRALGQAYLELGGLHKDKGRMEEARECTLKAIDVFEKCEADVFLEEAREQLSSL